MEWHNGVLFFSTQRYPEVLYNIPQFLSNWLASASISFLPEPPWPIHSPACDARCFSKGLPKVEELHLAEPDAVVTLLRNSGYSCNIHKLNGNHRKYMKIYENIKVHKTTSNKGWGWYVVNKWWGGCTTIFLLPRHEAGIHSASVTWNARETC